MNPYRALRRLFANSDRLTDLFAGMLETLNRLDSRIERLLEATANQSTSANERWDQIKEGIDNQSHDMNLRLDRGIETADKHSERDYRTLIQLTRSLAQQSNATGNRLDELIDLMKRSLVADHGENILDSSKSHGRLVVRNVYSVMDEGVQAPAKQSRPELKWLDEVSLAPLALPVWTGGLPVHEGGKARQPVPVNSLRHYQPLLDALQPWQGVVPKGFLVDFFGTLIDARFRGISGVEPGKSEGAYVRTQVPRLDGGNGEGWFEAINWIEAARAARNRFVMITLGACFGAQAVGAYRALQTINPMPCKLVAVEPEPENYLWLRKHFRDNGIDPEAHWLVAAAMSDANQPIFFPIGGAGSGVNNCMSTDQPREREILVEELIAQGRAEDTLRNLMLHNTTGIVTDVLSSPRIIGEIELVSAVTLRDLLAPFEVVDYVEADIQQSEARVFPPFLDLLRQKVRRIHIGTHGTADHDMLHDIFLKSGWEIIFSYGPNATYDSEVGKFELNDGVLTVRNPDL